MQVVIVAGGLGTRLGNLTKDRPKSLIPVNGKPFLQHQVESLKQNGIQDIVLCIGHLGNQIQETLGDGSKYGVKVRYSIEDRLLGTAGAIKKAENLLDDTFFTMYGDSYLFLDFAKIMNFFTSFNKSALMTVYKNFNLYDTSNTAIKDNLVRRYNKVDITEDMVYIDYGVNLFRKSVLDIIPEGVHYPLEKVFNQLIDKNQLLAFEVKKRFYEIGSFEGLMEFEKFIREQ